MYLQKKDISLIKIFRSVQKGGTELPQLRQGHFNGNYRWIVASMIWNRNSRN